MRPDIFHPTDRTPRPLRLFLTMLAALVVLTAAAALSPARATGTVPGILDAAMDKVLVIRSADDADLFLGSAFLWGEEADFAVTNAHVVGAALEVRIIDRQGRTSGAVVVARDEVRDIAIISLPESFGKRPGFVAGAAPELGATVWAMGAPLGIEFTLTKGVISAAPRQVEVAVPIRMVQHDAAVNPGSSGGPLVDAMGHLVGMNSRIADGSRMFVGIAYAIPAQDLSRLVGAMLAKALMPFPRLDMRARAVDRQIGAALGVGTSGLLIDSVVANGMADRAGLKAGDVILAVNGIVVEKAGDFAFLIEAAQAGDQADLAVLRGGQALVVMMDFETGAGVLAGAEPKETASDATRTATYSFDQLGVEVGASSRVEHIRENSPALWSGLAEGDLILAVNGHPMDATALREFSMAAPAIMLVRGAGGQTRHVIVDPWATQMGIRPVGGANVLDPAVVVF